MKTGDTLNLNLLPNQAKFQAAKIKLRDTLNRYMKWGLELWLLITVVTFALYFGSNWLLNRQTNLYNQAFAAYKNLAEEISVGQMLKYRAKVLGQVLGERFEYSAAFEKVNSLFADQAKVTNFNLLENSVVEVSVTAVGKSASEAIEDKVEKISKGEVEGVKSAKITSATYYRDGNWIIKMEVVLK